MSENMQFCNAFGGPASTDPLLAEMFGDYKLDAPSLNSSISPPLFENPSDINLEVSYISSIPLKLLKFRASPRHPYWILL